MPIFQDPDRQRFENLWSDDHQPRQDGHRQTISPWKHTPEQPLVFHSRDRREDSPHEGHAIDQPQAGLHASNREELIQYLKGADTLRWAQHRSLGETGACQNHAPQTPDKASKMKDRITEDTGPRDQPHSRDQDLASPADIERPRSALHSGDFREGTSQLQGQQHLPPSPIPHHHTFNAHTPQLGSSPTTPWFTAPIFSSLRSQPSVHTATPTARSRAPSLGSFSSSYILKAPTSPLVHQANNTDLDFSPRLESAGYPDPLEKANRRRTLPPESFQHLQASPTGHAGGLHFNHEPLRTNWDGAMSYQFHPPRRSLTSTYSLQLASSAQTPSSRFRRPSISAEVSSKAHAPMVGSYEESILRGRMSMNPSKPLDFTAQIGVLGKGKCKANLKCPPHVTIPFPAVFYSYPTSGFGRSISDDSPSPYVGLIDLDNFLPKDTSSSNGRRRRRHQSPAGLHDDQVMGNTLESKPNDQEALRRREKKHRRAESPKSPPGGCYRIPQHGQLQIMIKNPNKTAVKLFLVPYDLGDMEPGTKTFVRQRSYSAGPMIDMPMSARKNYGTDRPEASLNTSEDPKDKPTLRYLVHLNICCPSRGRFYLHSSIRVVFANRVPDGKEKLRNEIQYPDPRYTPYKPYREISHAHPSARSTTDKASRRVATGHDSVPKFSPSGLQASGESSHLGGSSTHFERRPFVFLGQETSIPPGNSRQPHHSDERPPHPFQPIPSLRVNPSPVEPEPTEQYQGLYGKLNKGDHGYGGYSSGFTGGPEAGDSLLARKLRRLDVQKHNSLNFNSPGA
ncbi:hypothetical protein BO70DRAFT_397742 [Aspergillus heteromorphus CBS 117.55]|uniref:Atos-like conserved domain-containing protein n=1 Tax=Aspergillus heteromorphus CBS 117.55 TaxID=1448321 RepID=A0A317VUC0_9EURO|nr:uncharacterized protein BO70DRAFT_397742 [Aspergillus heteromorphus CBS 117.55]PWY77455.1 hypothetical protein BO70DRAFT_397742 [Aspergillus heteromorphus CBS 117.55]